MTETALPLGADGRTLSGRGVRTRGRLLEAAEQIFADVGFHEASIVKITEAAGVAQGTFYLYFESKKQIFDELVRDLNSRVRHAMKEASSKGTTRVEAEVLGFAAYFRFTSEHKALYRIIRQAEFVSPEMLRYHYDRLSEGYVEGLREAVESGEIGDVDPKVTAWALMGMGELIGLRWILMENRDKMPKAVLDELERIIGCVLEAPLVTVGIAASAAYLPERWMTAAEISDASGIPEQVLVEKFGLRGKHIAARGRARQRSLRVRSNSSDRRARRRSRRD